MKSLSSRLRFSSLICVLLIAQPRAATAQSPQESSSEGNSQPAGQSTTSGTFVDGALRKVKALGFFQSSPTGFYPTVMTVYPGGWIALGGGYHHPFNNAAAVDVNAAWSVKNFKRVDTSLALPPPFDQRLALKIEMQWMDAPSVAFYGIGNDSQSDNRAEFRYRPTTVGVLASVAPLGRLKVGGGVGFVAIDTVSSLDAAPETLDVLGVPPGLTFGPRYLRSRVFAAVDTRPAPGYSTRGGMYRLEVEDYNDRNGSQLGFRSVEAEAVQLVPLSAANAVIAVHALTTMTDDRRGDDVPFYLMPAIGGNSSVRGYPSFRFRGNHRLLMSAEYRWRALRFLDVAAFYDAGRVASPADQLRLKELKWAYGVGARFHSTRRTTFRAELARNDEGSWRFVWSTGAAF